MEKEIKNNFWDGSDCKFTRVYGHDRTEYVDVMSIGHLIEFFHSISGMDIYCIAGINPNFAVLFKPLFFINIEVIDGKIKHEDEGYCGWFYKWRGFSFLFDGDSLTPRRIEHPCMKSIIPYDLLPSDFDYDASFNSIKEWHDTANEFI